MNEYIRKKNVFIVVDAFAGKEFIFLYQLFIIHALIQQKIQSTHVNERKKSPSIRLRATGPKPRPRPGLADQRYCLQHRTKSNSDA